MTKHYQLKVLVLKASPFCSFHMRALNARNNRTDLQVLNRLCESKNYKKGICFSSSWDIEIKFCTVKVIKFISKLINANKEPFSTIFHYYRWKVGMLKIRPHENFYTLIIVAPMESVFKDN